MTWAYGNMPSSSNRDAVRFLAGQTSSGDDVLASDEEVAFAIAQEGNNYRAAALVAESLARRYTTRATSKTVGQLSLTYQGRAKEFFDLAKDLRVRAGIRGGQIYAGGLTVSDQDLDRTDSDRVQPAFRVGMNDYLGNDTTGSS